MDSKDEKINKSSQSRRKNKTIKKRGGKKTKNIKKLNNFLNKKVEEEVGGYEQCSICMMGVFIVPPIYTCPSCKKPSCPKCDDSVKFKSGECKICRKPLFRDIEREIKCEKSLKKLPCLYYEEDTDKTTKCSETIDVKDYYSHIFQFCKCNEYDRDGGGAGSSSARDDPSTGNEYFDYYRNRILQASFNQELSDYLSRIRSNPVRQWR